MIALLADSGLPARKLGGSGRVIVASPDCLARVGTSQVAEGQHGHNGLVADNGETLGQLAAPGMVLSGWVEATQP